VRVACVTRRFPSSKHPWAGHSGYQTLRLLAKRCDLHVFYPETTYPSFLTPRGSFPLDRNWNPPDVQTTYVPVPGLPVISRPFNGALTARAMYPYVRDFRPDVLLSYFLYPDGYASVRIAQNLGVPAVLTAVGSDINSIPDALCRRLTQTALRQADFVSTVSSDLRAKAIVLGADPAHTRTKLNGCDTTIFYPQDRTQARAALNLDPNAEIVVYVGRMDLRKGLIELIEAVAQLAPRRPNLRCYMVGDGPDSPALLQAIATHNVADRITIVPPCGTAEVAQWMAASNLVTLPSYNEGCPNVVLEALAAGRPVVATDVGGIPELMDDTCGRMVPARHVPALTQALDEVLNESWDATAISSRHGRGWSDVADDLYQILDETIDRRRAR
jgi:teichuronic acid biosynthesis glycosyltransferase TuaC